MIFLDTSYLARLYLDEPGHEIVRALASEHRIASSWHGQSEFLCVLHRAFREKRLSEEAYTRNANNFAAIAMLKPTLGFR